MLIIQAHMINTVSLIDTAIVEPRQLTKHTKWLWIKQKDPLHVLAIFLKYFLVKIYSGTFVEYLIGYWSTVIYVKIQQQEIKHWIVKGWIPVIYIMLTAVVECDCLLRGVAKQVSLIRATLVTYSQHEQDTKQNIEARCLLELNVHLFYFWIVFSYTVIQQYMGYTNVNAPHVKHSWLVISKCVYPQFSARLLSDRIVL